MGLLILIHSRIKMTTSSKIEIDGGFIRYLSKIDNTLGPQRVLVTPSRFHSIKSLTAMLKSSVTMSTRL